MIMDMKSSDASKLIHLKSQNPKYASRIGESDDVMLVGLKPLGLWTETRRLPYAVNQYVGA